MKLTKEQIESNKQEFLGLLTSIKESRPNANWDALVKKLEGSDFFYAPASTKYHAACEGGLCQHSLNVYRNLCELVAMKGYDDIIAEDSIIIVSLLHDLGKMNFYQQTTKNVKKYSEFGAKSDNKGNFDWVTEESYMVIPDDDRDFIIGSHEVTCEYMVSCFIKLKPEESAAILHHHGGLGYDSSPQTAPKVMAKYKLACLLHLADMLAAYVDEEENE